MCGEHPYQDRLGAAEQEDEYVLDTPTVRRFIGECRVAIDEAPTPEEGIQTVRPVFVRLRQPPMIASERMTGNAAK